MIGINLNHIFKTYKIVEDTKTKTANNIICLCVTLVFFYTYFAHEIVMLIIRKTPERPNVDEIQLNMEKMMP